MTDQSSGDPVAQGPGAVTTYAAWVEPHLGVLSAIAVREAGRADAADLVQNTLLRAWRRRSTFDAARGSPRAWLVGVLLGEARRLRSRPQPITSLLSHDPHPAQSPSDGAELRLDLETAIRSLPPRQRQAVALFYLADLSVDDVAGVLGISPGSVKTHLSAARSALRRALEDA